MDRETIEIKIQEGLKIQAATWKSPMSPLYSDKSKAQPEYLRSLDNSFYSYGSDAEVQKFYSSKMVATSEQQKLALEVMDLIGYACKRHVANKRPIVRAIISLRCMNLDSPSYGYRQIAKALKNANVKISHMTIKRYYDTSMEDLVHFFLKK